MSNNNRLWILGASDPEMAAIERLLAECGESVAYAVGPDGERVHPGNAYRSVGFRPAGTNDLCTRDTREVYLVECGGDLPPDAKVIDHHRPGDPGYGRPPEEFLPASSIGQVIAELARIGRLSWPMRSTDYCPTAAGVQYAVPDWGADPWGVWIVSGRASSIEEGGAPWAPIPPHIVMTAAADHCLESAYRYRCPGVDPDALMRWRASTRAAHQGRTVEAIMADIEAARARLRVAVTRCEYEHPMGGGVVEHHLPDAPYADLRGENVPELPEAACREGVAYLATVRDRDGREKVVLGAASPDLVERFMAGEIVGGLTGVYGDPARGFAGGYLAPQG